MFGYHRKYSELSEIGMMIRDRFPNPRYALDAIKFL